MPLVAFRLTERERESLRAAAAAQGITVSEAIRESLSVYVRSHRQAA